MGVRAKMAPQMRQISPKLHKAKPWALEECPWGGAASPQGWASLRCLGHRELQEGERPWWLGGERERSTRDLRGCQRFLGPMGALGS